MSPTSASSRAARGTLVTWRAGREPMTVGDAGECRVLWVVDDDNGRYVRLTLVESGPDDGTESAEDLVADLCRSRSGGSGPDRLIWHGEPRDLPMLVAAVAARGVELRAARPRDRSWGRRLRDELLERRTFDTAEDARLQLEEYALLANLRRGARFVETNRRLGEGIVQPAYADDEPDILLIHLLNWFDAGRAADEIFSPIGSSFIAATLADAGHRVRLELFRHDGRVDAMPASLRARAPRLVGISATGFEIHELKRLSHAVARRWPSVSIIVGGYCTMAGDRLFDDSAIDVAVVGEGEQTVRTLVPRMLAGDDVADVAGILYRDAEGDVTRTAPRDDVPQLDVLPSPTYAQLPSNAGIIRVAASRGCPYQCIFCSIKDFYTSRRIRYHGPDYIARQIQALGALHDGPITHVFFNDDEFLLDPEHLRRMATMARSLGLGIGFETRVTDILRHRDLLESNRDVVAQVYMGVESFSQAQLDRWKKGTTVAQNQEAAGLLATWGIHYLPLLILTDEHTTIDELDENCRGILALPPSPVRVVLTDATTVTLHIPPIRLGARMNRMLSFFGDAQRRPETRYLDAVWFFLLATDAEAGALVELYRGALAESARRGDDPKSHVEAIGDLLDQRVADLPALAAEAAALHQAESIKALAAARAEAFRRRSLAVTFDYVTRADRARVALPQAAGHGIVGWQATSVMRE